jgi:hypothetical protein
MTRSEDIQSWVRCDAPETVTIAFDREWELTEVPE